MLFRRPSLAPSLGFSAFCALSLAAPMAFAAGVEVPLDQVRILTFKAPVKTLFVGNPVIADVTIIDSTHAFVLGRNFGTTNVIALDSSGKESANEQIVVPDRPGSLVTVQRGPLKMTMTCSSTRCEAVPSQGDEKPRFDALSGQMETREALNLKAAGK